MINIFYDLKKLLFKSLLNIAAKNNIVIKEEDFNNFNVEPSKERTHGDLATNIAMVLSKYFSQMHLFDSYVTKTLCILYILNSCSSYIFSPKTDLSGFQTLSKNTFAILIHYLNYFCL